MVPHLVAPECNRISRLIWGLNPEIRTLVRSNNPKTYEDTIEAGMAIAAEISHQKDDINKKRKWSHDGPSGRQEDNNKKFVRRDNVREINPCKTCGRRHPGKCRFDIPNCSNCKKPGHTTTNCTEI
jgi:hypothetical protein